MNATIKLTVSHNEVTANYSVMCKPSTLKVKIDGDKAKLAQQFPYLLDVWGQQIWDMNHPNTFGKVVKVEFCN
jgi:hypothetical protein